MSVIAGILSMFRPSVKIEDVPPAPAVEPPAMPEDLALAIENEEAQARAEAAAAERERARDIVVLVVDDGTEWPLDFLLDHYAIFVVEGERDVMEVVGVDDFLAACALVRGGGGSRWLEARTDAGALTLAV